MRAVFVGGTCCPLARYRTHSLPLVVGRNILPGVTKGGGWGARGGGGQACLLHGGAGDGKGGVIGGGGGPEERLSVHTLRPRWVERAMGRGDSVRCGRGRGAGREDGGRVLILRREGAGIVW